MLNFLLNPNNEKKREIGTNTCSNAECSTWLLFGISFIWNGRWCYVLNRLSSPPNTHWTENVLFKCLTCFNLQLYTCHQAVSVSSSIHAGTFSKRIYQKKKEKECFPTHFHSRYRDQFPLCLDYQLKYKILRVVSVKHSTRLGRDSFFFHPIIFSLGKIQCHIRALTFFES